MNKLIKTIKDKRNDVLFKKLLNFINRKTNKKKKKIILDLGSGKECFVAKKLQKKSKLKKKYTYLNYDFFNKKEIIENKKKGLKCLSLKNVKKQHSDIIILNDTLHHIFHKKIDYNEVGKYFNNLLKKTECIFIKDHFVKNYFDVIILKIMDWIGNKDNPFSKLPNNYFEKKKFLKILKEKRIIIKNLSTKTKYYPSIFLFFSRSTLHFTAELYKDKSQ